MFFYQTECISALFPRVEFDVGELSWERAQKYCISEHLCANDFSSLCSIFEALSRLQRVSLHFDTFFVPRDFWP